MNKTSRLLLSVILMAWLLGCSGGSPVDVAGKFWKAVNDGNLEKARSYASRETAASLTISDPGGMDAEVGVEFGAETVEGGRTIIETRTVTRMGDFSQTVEMKTVLVQEDGKWKVDVMDTMMSMFGEEARAMMEGMAEAVGQMTEEMGSAMLEGVHQAFGQIGRFGVKSRMMQEPEMLSGPRDFRIKFGYMKKRPNGAHYVYKETTKIPMRTRGFKWGYTIEAKGDPFTTHAVDYSPDGPMSGSGYSIVNSQGEEGWESNITTVTGGYYSRAYHNDPGDTPGARKIEVYIEDKLAEVIEFEVGTP